MWGGARSPSHSSFWVGISVQVQIFHLAVSWWNHAFAKPLFKMLIHKRNSNVVQKETQASPSFQLCLCYSYKIHHTKTSSSPIWHSTLSATLTQSNTVAQHRSNLPIRSVGVLWRTHSISWRWVGCGEVKLQNPVFVHFTCLSLLLSLPWIPDSLKSQQVNFT